MMAGESQQLTIFNLQWCLVCLVTFAAEVRKIMPQDSMHSAWHIFLGRTFIHSIANIPNLAHYLKDGAHKKNRYPDLNNISFD